MKKVILLVSFLFFSFFLWSQTMDLPEFNQERLHRQKVNMMILGGWAVGNIAIGAALLSRREGEDRYFHMMNLGWGVINLGLATAGYLGAANADPAAFDLYETVKAQHNLQKIFLLNAGLDVGYIMGGLYLVERSKNTEKHPERMKGFGRSIILQGGFLFVFDLAAYFVNAAANSKLQPFLSSLYFDGQQLGLVLNF